MRACARVFVHVLYVLPFLCVCVCASMCGVSGVRARARVYVRVYLHVHVLHVRTSTCARVRVGVPGAVLACAGGVRASVCRVPCAAQVDNVVRAALKSLNRKL